MNGLTLKLDFKKAEKFLRNEEAPMSTETQPQDETEDVITTLKDLLAAANRGELVGLTNVCIWRDLGTTYGMAGNVLANPFHSLDALEYAKAELVHLVTEAIKIESNGEFRA
jgi:hypothetical protein